MFDNPLLCLSFFDLFVNVISEEVLIFDFKSVCDVIYSFQVHTRSIDAVLLPGVSKKYSSLAGEREIAVRYHYAPSVQIYSSVFNLDTRIFCI